MLTLGRFSYPRPVILLAPMAGVSDLPFRRLCQANGADYSTAEMVSAKPDLLHTDLAQNRLQFDPDPHYPKIVQLVGGDPALMAEAALVMQAKGADIIDINLGCPAKTVARQQAGSALLADLGQVAKILAAVSRAVSIPVTVKTRLGYHDDQPTLFELAAIAEDNGIAALAVHGRSRAQKYNGTADHAAIGALKNRTRLPVIANGDIRDAAQAKTLIDRYGFDGLMIGRAALGDPWLFARCQAAVNGIPAPAADKNAQIRTHLHDLHRHYGAQATRIARKHLHAYLREHPAYAALRDAINHATDLAAQLATLDSAAI